jgi:hypothetical protein
MEHIFVGDPKLCSSLLYPFCPYILWSAKIWEHSCTLPIEYLQTGYAGLYFLILLFNKE